jgi:hypothetical protein
MDIDDTSLILKIQNEKIQKTKSLKWFFLDFGNNYIINNIDFTNKIIRLKDSKTHILINFNIYENLSYKTCILKYENYVLSLINDNLLNLESARQYLHNPEYLTSYFNEYVLEMIIEDLFSKNNNMDNVYNIEDIKLKIYCFPVFTYLNSQYICVCNFSNFISKSLQKCVNSNIYNNINSIQLISLENGVNRYDSSIKLNGYIFNLMKAIWYRIVNNTNLALKEYNIDKLKFNLGHLIYSLLNKFPDYYIIFDVISSKLDLQNHNFIMSFKNLKDKTKRGKYLNSVKDASNKLIQLKIKECNKNIINIEKVFDKLSIKEIINNNELKVIKSHKKNNNFILTNSSNILQSNKEKEKEKEKENIRKNTHLICNNLTGSKHCYYSGYKELVINFDKFNLNNDTNIYNLVNLDINDINNSDDMII